MPDIVINPSTIIVNGAEVSEANPLPVTSLGAPPAGTSILINPRTLVVNGALVSPSNPLPIIVV